ncbi:chorismate-binding protein [Adhaeribacter radiodurans]|uniref:Chorismate-binding protein n=1 Tax=Adhaeribacter radiodurans TaxID=2745197 RepID=A0A7L7L6T4_9BACT|nr:chorismate-binding protein [Adhaeribacter radiodurans]QMU28541.1 chorismate-binding protein [Adhaeribacter radiodurans]
MNLEGDYKVILKALFATAIRFQLPVAVWRLPGSNSEIKLCVSLRPAQTSCEVPQLESGTSGFAFYPFQVSEKYPAQFIKADITYSSLLAKLKFNFKLNENPDYVALVQRLQDYFAKIKESASANNWHVSRKVKPHQTPECEFKQLVEEGIKAIEAGLMEKVVLSRVRVTELSAGFDVVDTFIKLQETYPNAFTSLVSIPDTGTWMGASPEILVQVSSNKIFKTVALAGTQPLTPGSNPAKAMWQQKEIEEQSMVERYILNCFKSIRLREYQETGPRTVVAGNLMHLRTDFTVNMNEETFPTLGTQMLQLLHPTSAVCGMPKEPATAFILQKERYDRAYFSGFLGPVNINGESNIYVNLRCTQFLEQVALTYAGAGITTESEPDKEWMETRMKMDTMRQVFRIQPS